MTTTTARQRAWAIGRERRALLADLVDRGLGDAAVRAMLSSERPDLLPAGRYAGERLTREIRAARGAHEAAASGDPAVEYVRSLRRQLRLIEAAMAKSASPDLASLAHRLTREIALCEGVAASIVGPGGKVKRLNAVPADAGSTPAVAGSTPDTAKPAPVGGDDPEMRAIREMLDAYHVKDG